MLLKSLYDLTGEKMIEPNIKKPSLFRTSVMKLVNGWRRVMDVRYNPLKYVPDPSLQTYFMLVLFTLWSVFFGFLAANYLGFFNYNTVASIVIHYACNSVVVKKSQIICCQESEKYTP